LKSRRPTGEIVRPNATGRDAILSRIIWLSGLEGANRNAYERGIYIHGTPEERKIGRPVSYGCIRMRSCDVIRLFDEVPVGAKIQITTMPVHLAAQSAGNICGNSPITSLTLDLQGLGVAREHKSGQKTSGFQDHII
jgi:hypothetical protein